jgi:hypothetical protein
MATGVALLANSSNTFDIEWPPRSGRRQAFPEVDRAEWFDLDAALRRRHLRRGKSNAGNLAAQVEQPVLCSNILRCRVRIPEFLVEEISSGNGCCEQAPKRDPKSDDRNALM